MHTCTCLHPPSLCLLISVFNPFTFKVIFAMYNPVTVFLIVLGLFSVGPFLVFLPREVPLVFVVKLVWWCWIFLTFACLESFWFLHQIWRRVLLSGFLDVCKNPNLSAHEIHGDTSTQGSARMCNVIDGAMWLMGQHGKPLTYTCLFPLLRPF